MTEKSPKFVISAAEARSTAAVDDFLRSLIGSAGKSLARPPISNFPVAAAGLGSSTGRVFLGVNVEFPGVPLHHSIHAEQFLIANLALHGEPSLSSLAVSAAPCGHCRQFLQELRRASDLRISISGDSDEPLRSLLPRRFGPSDLLPGGAAFLLEPRRNLLALHVNSDASSDLSAAALAAADASHAPYSGCPSGVAVADRAGRVFAGSYMESAAYNPSLGPVQAAVVAFIVGGGGGFEEITAAVLVEVEGAAVAQEETARMLLRAISPSCEFTAIRCVKKKNED